MKRFKKYLWLLYVVVSCTIVVGVAYSQTETDVLINDDYSGSEQNSPRLAISNSGNIMIVWADKRYGNSYIFCQMLDSALEALGYNQPVNDDYLSIPHDEPAVAFGAGIFKAVWKDYRNGDYPYYPDIFMASVDTTATPENYLVSVVPPNMQCESPDIAMFQNGNAIVVWSDYRYNNWDIFGQRMSSGGELIGSPFRINDDAGNNQQHSPRVAKLPDNGFVVVWYDNRNGDDDIYFQRYDSLASRIGNNLRVNSDNSEKKQAYPAVAADGNGRFFIAWIDWINGVYPQNPDVYLRRYDSSGTALGAAVRVNANDCGRAQKQVNLCADNVGNICVVWADSNYGQWNACGQIYDPSGVVNGNNFVIHNDTTGKQLQPDVATDSYRFYFTWADSRSGNFDIYADYKQYNEPDLVAFPDNIELTMPQGGELPAPVDVVLVNAGYGTLNWVATTSASWLSVTPSSGQTPDTIQVAITNDSLAYGTYSTTIRLIDAGHNDSSQVISVTLDVTEPPIEPGLDTVQFFSTNAAPNGIGVMPVYIYLVDSSRGGYIPIGYDTTTATLDSIVPNQSALPSFVDFYTNVTSSGVGELGFRIDESMINDSIIVPGNYHIGNLFFTAGSTETFNTVDTISSDSSGAYILGSDFGKNMPAVITGNLIISDPTSVENDNNRPIFPDQPHLEQNFPNPFNSTTAIKLSLPKTIEVSIGIYNLLGQPVYTLHDGALAPGEYTLKWDGRLDSGLPAPSGIYYCRLVAGNATLVRKMVLLR